MASDDDWYDSPRYYDLIFDEDTVDEADFLEAMMWKYGVADTGRILEPACGSGRLVSEFARRGYAVDGFDLNENMLEFAQRRSPGILRILHRYEHREHDTSKCCMHARLEHRHPHDEADDDVARDRRDAAPRHDREHGDTGGRCP